MNGHSIEFGWTRAITKGDEYPRSTTLTVNHFFGCSRAHNSVTPGQTDMKIVSCTSTLHNDDIFQVSSQSLKKCWSSSLHKLVVYCIPLCIKWLSSRAHNSVMPGTTDMKIVSCTSTLHGDDIFQVSNQSSENCGSSSLHKHCYIMNIIVHKND